MKVKEEDIIQFIEPVFRFCLNHVSNRTDAEDLASEIILYVLDGIRKYEINSLDGWVWRIAHNRYARFCEDKKRWSNICHEEILQLEEYSTSIAGNLNFIDAEAISSEYEEIFRYLHTLSSEYRNILVDYYIGEIPVKALAAKYGLTETTIKWRLNVGRQKIRDRIKSNSKGECGMDRIYKRINWETGTCNGFMDPSAYLSNQVARAICEAAYEKPLTIDEISLKTGLPTIYIEDALPRLIYGDAIEQVNSNKYATNFIILRLKDREQMEKQFKLLIGEIAEHFEKRFAECADKVEKMDFYGHDFGIKRLGYIAIPLALRKKVKTIKESIPSLADGPYPPRKDGGYGWFIVEESEDERDMGSKYSSGCNSAGGENGFIYWYWISKYISQDIYHNGGLKWFAAKQIPQKCTNGVIPDGILLEDDIIRLLKLNLIVRTNEEYKLNFACFTQEQFAKFSELFNISDQQLEKTLTELILSIKKSFVSFVPKRLESQINQWVSSFVHRIYGYVTDELIARSVLEKPDEEKPLTNGVFYVEGKYIDV